MSERELKELHTRRGVLKGQITRFESFLNSLVPNDPKLTQIQMRLEKLSLTWNSFDDVQSKIELLNNVNDELVEREEFENHYFQVVDRANGLAKQLTKDDNAQTKQSSNEQQNIKLPQIELPEFSGSYEEWFLFKDTFNALINKNTNLTAIQKYYYLQSALRGEAKRVINYLEVSELNYTVAWNLLETRFENKKVIMRLHLKNIFELPNVVANSFISLRHFLDSFLKHFKALENLELPVESWDAIVLYLLVTKLDHITKKEWEAKTSASELPTVKEFIEFISTRSQFLETIDTKYQNEKHKIRTHMSTNKPCCMFCKGDHFIAVCKKFLSLDKNTRLIELKNKKICTNCLRHGHNNFECRAGGCKICSKRHNSLLHFESKNKTHLADTNTESESSNTRSTNLEVSKGKNDNAENCNIVQELGVLNIDNEFSASIANYSQQTNECFVLLSTAIIYIVDSQNNPVKCRALLDNGSQSSFMTKNLFDKLNLESQPINLPVIGISSASINVSRKTSATIKSAYNSYQTKTSFLILNHITGNIPQFTINPDELNIPANIKLADPEFYKSKQIDILIGSSIFYELLSVGQIRLGPEKPVLQKTLLGWLIAGPINVVNVNVACHLTSNNEINSEIDKQLEKFWLTEEMSTKKMYTKEESECEQEFVKTVKRNPVTGQFTVNLPLRDNYTLLGESQTNAIQRCYSLEAKLQKNPNIRNQYDAFMKEYVDLGHMTKLDDPNEYKGLSFYLPHHCVTNESSLTTKLRVVFDGSAKSSTSLSLNDVLKVGPVIQDELYNILVRFRKHNVVMTADIAKMYRQIEINPTQRHLQKIVWRFDPSEPLTHYVLNTITYGTSSASFLSTRCLQQLAFENETKYPLASQIIFNDLYVDDLITGASDVHSAKQLFINLTTIMKQGNFELRKWVSNEPSIFEHEDMEYLKNIQNFIIPSEQNCKTLGIWWNAKNDTFQYVNSNWCDLKTVSKRQMLSISSQIFDPLGLVGPVVLKAKLVLQKLWLLKIDWDESIPVSLFTEWQEFYNSLPLINKIIIPRQIALNHFISIQVHAFSDASELAYGTCIYLRTQSQSGEILVRLITAKSRVAPLKTLTIPRLELNGALLMARLVNKVTASLKMEINDIFYWCDSTIVLSWLKTEPSKLKTFVAHRISEIQQITVLSNWQHVPTKFNPADLISRGLNPEDLANTRLWWQGPAWLSLARNNWPQNSYSHPKVIPELKTVICHVSSTELLDQAIFNRFSSYNKLQRVIAYCLRFIQNAKCPKEVRLYGNLSVQEIKNATMTLTKLAQIHEFNSEIDSLKHNKCISKHSKLKTLDPFIDDEGILRVGGRLQNTSLQFGHKHPIILPSNHRLTELIIRNEHLKNLHSGAQLTLNCVRQQYWPLNGKQVTRKIIRRCIKCFRVNPSSLDQKMGVLPHARVTPARPFQISGVDYAGPFLIKDGKFRNRKFLKSYICIFICFSSKAVHLELASDLTKEGFLNALKRFVARRGLCTQIYSDNATNFAAANKELQKIAAFESDDRVQHFLTDNHITWNFIPPRSPHMGGLWENAVKQAKYHLKRVIHDTPFTYEEFYTLIAQVESILNSRPLYPLSPDPKDFNPLTPGHFLVGEPLTAIPQPNPKVEGRIITRYQHLQKVLRDFWNRWSRDYLSTLQQRSKWRFQKDAPALKGSLVVLKEDNVPPQSWPLGRIIDLHPGADGLVRVVSVQTRCGVVKRAIVKVCLLPLETDIDCS